MTYSKGLSVQIQSLVRRKYNQCHSKINQILTLFPNKNHTGIGGLESHDSPCSEETWHTEEPLYKHTITGYS